MPLFFRPKDADPDSPSRAGSKDADDGSPVPRHSKEPRSSERSRLSSDSDLNSGAWPQRTSQTIGGQIPAVSSAFDPRSISLWQEMRIIIHRQGTLALRDKVINLGRCIAVVIGNSFLAVVYFKSRDRKQDQVINKTNLALWLVGLAAAMSIIEVYAGNMDYKATRREMRNGMVNPSVFVLASNLMQLPFVFLFSFCALALPAYVLGDFYLPNAGHVLLLHGGCIYAFDSLAQLLSILFDNPYVGILVALNRQFRIGAIQNRALRIRRLQGHG